MFKRSQRTTSHHTQGFPVLLSIVANRAMPSNGAGNLSCGFATLRDIISQLSV
jgi:hypothetical protein